MIDFDAFQKPAKNNNSAGQLKNKVLSYVRSNGPALPVTVSSGLKLNTIMVGAILSQLISEKQVKISSCKIGGSPLYYVPGQENKLTKIRDYMSQKPKEIFDILKENKILRDSELESWQRVAIREIKDFAHPLDVTIDGQTETFWKWYMIDEQQSNQLISKILNPEKSEPQEKELEVKEPVREEPEKREVQLQEKPEPKQQSAEEKPEPRKSEPEKLPKKESSEEKPVKKKKTVESPLRDKTLEILNKMEVEILEENCTKKTECSFVINFESPIGKLKYLVISKKKKNISEDDVHIAHSLGVHEKLPVLLMAKGIGKKANEVLESKGIVFKKL